MVKRRQLVEIWGDIVELKSLVFSIIISIISTMGAYFLAPPTSRTKQLFFGLGGAVVGFFISSILIKPKRIIEMEDERKEK